MIFKPEDFGLDDYYNKEDSYPQLTSWEAAKIANQKLKAWLETSPKLKLTSNNSCCMDCIDTAQLQLDEWLNKE